MSTHQKVLGNAFAQFAGKFLTVVASLVIVKIVTSIGTEFYGNYVTAYEFLAFFGILADAGLFAIAVREMSRRETREKDEFILGNVLSMRLILIVGVVLLAGIVAQFVPNYAPEVRTGIWITAISMGLTIIAGTLSSVLQARMKIQYLSGSLVLGKILLAVLIFLIAQNVDLFSENLLLTMLWAGVASNVIFCSLVTYFVSREVRIRLQFDFDWWRKTLKVSLPYGLALILQTLYLRIDVILISILLGASAVGIYGVPTRILESLLILGVFFGQAIFPKISAEEHSPEAVGRTLRWGTEKLLILSLPIIIGITAFLPDVILILSSQEFLSAPGFFGSDGVLKILIPTVFFAFFNQLFTFTLVTKNRQNYLLLVNGVALAINAALNIIFLPKFGIIAAAVSTILCEVVVFVFLTREIFRHFSLPFSQKNLGLIILANALLMGEIYLTPIGESLTLSIVFGSLTYFGFLWIFRRNFVPE